MNSYKAYGLTIESELALPELLPATGPADVSIRFATLSDQSLPDEPDGKTAGGNDYWVVGDEIHLFNERLGRFVIRGGREILMDPRDDASEDRLRIFFMGPALAGLLHQRGSLVLHSSAVSVEGRAVAFLGGPGWGKSTMAATLFHRGHEMLTDDVLAIDVNSNGGASVVPAFPQFKLWPETVRALGQNPDDLRRLSAHYEKRAQNVSEGFKEEPVEMAGIYVLGEGPEISTERMTGQSILLQFIKHSYMNMLIGSTYASQHFKQCTLLASRVPVYLLRRPRDISRLGEVAQHIEEELLSVAS